MTERLDGDGPPPDPSDEDQLEGLEERIGSMDRPLGAEDHTTAAEGVAGDTLDERLAREEPDRRGRRATEPTIIADEDRPDADPELIGEEAGNGGLTGPEEAAMHVVEDAPGATDHEDDYVED